MAGARSLASHRHQPPADTWDVCCDCWPDFIEMRRKFQFLFSSLSENQNLFVWLDTNWQPQRLHTAYYQRVPNVLYSVQREHDNLDIYLVHNTPRTAQSAMTLWGEWGLIVPITKLEAVSNVPRLCQISAICPGCGVAGGCQLLPRPAPGRVMECWVSQHCSLRGLQRGEEWWCTFPGQDNSLHPPLQPCSFIQHWEWLHSEIMGQWWLRCVELLLQ